MKQRARRLPFLHPLCALLVCAPILALFPAPGCAAERSVATQPATAPARQFHLHLNGIGGYMRIDRAMLIGLREGGFTGEIRPYDWTGADAGLAALTVKRRHAEQSKKVAELIAAEAREHPGARITVTCHSAGAGIITWALEQLPDDVKIERLIYLAPALSPTYDLSKALRHVRGIACVFYSPYDAAVLGVGTRTFGTVDGQKVDASGKVGFTRPEAGDAEQYLKLVQFPYRASWAELGNIGDHIGAMAEPFAERILAPIVLNGSLPPADDEAADPLRTPPPPTTAAVPAGDGPATAAPAR